MSDVITIADPQTVIVESDDTTVIETTSNNVIVAEGTSGPQGIQGPQGPVGPSGTGDKSFTQDFLTSSSVTVLHSLNKRPSVTVINSANDEIEGDVDYIDLNTVQVSFAGAMSGSVVCN